MNMNDHFCGRVTNVGIDSRYAFPVRSMFRSGKHRVTGILVTTHGQSGGSGGKTVAILGTTAGSVLKVSTPTFLLQHRTAAYEIGVSCIAVEPHDKLPTD